LLLLLLWLVLLRYARRHQTALSPPASLSMLHHSRRGSRHFDVPEMLKSRDQNIGLGLGVCPKGMIMMNHVLGEVPDPSEATATWRFTNFVLYCIHHGEGAI